MELGHSNNNKQLTYFYGTMCAKEVKVGLASQKENIIGYRKMKHMVGKQTLEKKQPQCEEKYMKKEQLPLYLIDFQFSAYSSLKKTLQFQCSSFMR